MRPRFKLSVLLLLTLLAGAAQAQTGTVRGRVESSTGTVLAGAVVRASLRSGPATTAATDTTAADGSYELAGLAAGRYSVSVSMAGFRGDGRDNVSVEAGQTVTLPAFRLVATGPPPASTLALAGTVTDALTRRPLGGVRVLLQNAEGTTLAGDTTGADGTFSVRASVAARGGLTLRLEAAGYVAVRLPAVFSAERLVIPLVPTATASGAIAGTVKADGQPVAGARVRLVRIDPLALPLTREATTGATGAYRFDSLTAGAYLLSAEAAGFRPAAGEARVTAGQTLQKDINLRGAAPEPARVEVTGRVVTDGTGAPVAHARVTLYAVRDSGAVRPAGTGVTKADGTFSVRVAPGAYLAAVRVGGERGAPSYAEFYRDAATPAEATPLSVGTLAATVVEFSVPPAPQRVAVRVRGTVTDAAGAPLAGALVTLAPRDLPGVLAVARTAADGTYDAQFEAYAPLALIASARREGYATEYYRGATTPAAATAVLLSAAPYEATGIHFTLTARGTSTGASLAGLVSNAAAASPMSAPVGGATVRVYSPRAQATATTGTDGRYRLDGLGAGPYVVLGTADGFAPTYAGSTLGTWLDATRWSLGAAALTADVALAPFSSPGGTNRIAGKASTRRGEPVAGALVRAFDAQKRLAAYTFSNERGGYELAGLDSGRHVVTVELPFAGVWGETVDVDTASAVQGIAHFVVTPEGAATAIDPAPATSGLALDVPLPNPARGAVVLRFALAEAAPVTLRVFDALGRTVAMVAAGERAAGDHRIAYDAAALAPGLYLVRLDAGAQHRTQALVVAR